MERIEGEAHEESDSGSMFSSDDTDTESDEDEAMEEDGDEGEDGQDEDEGDEDGDEEIGAERPIINEAWEQYVVEQVEARDEDGMG